MCSFPFLLLRDNMWSADGSICFILTFLWRTQVVITQAACRPQRKSESRSPFQTPLTADCEENLSPPAAPWNTQMPGLSEVYQDSQRFISKGKILFIDAAHIETVPVVSQRSHVHVHRCGVRPWSALQPITAQTHWACDHRRSHTAADTTEHFVQGIQLFFYPWFDHLTKASLKC